MINNLEYFNSKRLIDNEVYAYLNKLKEMKREIPEISSGLDYYKMWLSQYNHNKDSITAKSNVENYVGVICEQIRKFDNTIEDLKRNFNQIFGDDGNEILMSILDFVFDIKNIKNIKKFYNLTQEDILLRLEAASVFLKNYWG